ncbi:hypothetical protein [Poseidonibacter lekithochrous]|uniref:hypothetical protein n=1 Tax=Poseidonibacter lekithochrous TaxID=1904463 RepID=UPI0008FCA95C|nr:hypothetical protein [Poseidonibacter lekithochrous]QKJ22083.1 putative membrane protein [Poseidonibacter lekithochrous]
MKSFSNTVRSLHRDLGYFVIGLTLIYAITGIILSGRGLGWFKQEFKSQAVIQKSIETKKFNDIFIAEVQKGTISEVFPTSSYESVKKHLNLKLKKQEDTVYFYKAWRTLEVRYDSNNGSLNVKYVGYPAVVELFIDAHKAAHEGAWFYLAILYSVILSFLAISSFWMVKGKNGFKRRGIYFMLAGFVVVGIFLSLG